MREENGIDWTAADGRGRRVRWHGASRSRYRVTTTSAQLPRSIYFAGDATHRTGLSLDEINRIVAAKEGHLWVDIDVDNQAQAELLKGIKGLHPLAVEDALLRQSRPKIEEFPDYLFMIILGVRFRETTEDPYDLETYDLCFFLGATFLVTVHAGRSDAVEDVAERVAKSPDLLSRGVDRLTHAIMDGSVDAYFPLLDKIDEFVDSLEQRVIVDFDQSALREIFSVKRLVLSLRRHVGPEREVFNILTNRPSALLSPDSQIYFRDIYDHVLRINDSIDTYRDLLSSVLDSYLTQVSNRLGRITKGLSVIATISIPFVVMSGMWGMNVDNIPLARHPHAFWWMLAIQVILGVLLFAVLRLRKLL
jgi:magnesium transporter